MKLNNLELAFAELYRDTFQCEDGWGCNECNECESYNYIQAIIDRSDNDMSTAEDKNDCNTYKLWYKSFEPETYNEVINQELAKG